MHRGHAVTRVAGAYRGYVFARWDASDGVLWRLIKDTRDVVGILGGEFPWPMLPGVVEDWVGRADEEGVVPGLEPPTKHRNLGYGAGDYVRLTYGSFENTPAYCDWVDEIGAHLQIKGLLGRDLSVYIPFVTGATIELTPINSAPDQASEYKRKRRRQARSVWSRQARMVEAS